MGYVLRFVPVAKNMGESNREWGRQGEIRNPKEIMPLISRIDEQTTCCVNGDQARTTDQSFDRRILIKNVPR
jgi:hypothetical protein